MRGNVCQKWATFVKSHKIWQFLTTLRCSIVIPLRDVDSQLRSQLHAIRGEESPEAPTLAMKSAAMSKTDEPWAWECREALRELVIGKAVEFKV